MAKPGGKQVRTGEEYWAWRAAIAQRSADKRAERYPNIWGKDPAITPWRIKAIAAVGRAIRRGELARLDGSIACVDCAQPARVYDHRDYGKPLDVQPVCRSCNRKRGHATFPKD